MTSLPKDLLADASEIRKAVKTLRKKPVIERLIRRGMAPERIETIIRDAEAAAEIMASNAMARIAHRKRAKLRVIKS